VLKAVDEQGDAGAKGRPETQR
jgi:hypothetical protein